MHGLGRLISLRGWSADGGWTYEIGGRGPQPAPAGPQALLAAAPRGAYTAAVVRDGYLVEHWAAHVRRLAVSLAALHAAATVGGGGGGGGVAYDAYYAWLRPRLAGCGGGGGAAAAAEDAALQAALLPPLLACLRGAAAARGAPAPRALLIVLLAPGGGAGGGGPPLEVHVAAGAQPAAADAAAAAWAVALGAPRAVPAAKDSGWVAARRGLEAARPEGAAEVLLCARDGALVEGLVTNLFVVAAEGGGGEGGDDKGGAGAGLVLLTASVGEGAVWGVARAAVLRAAAAAGLRVRERAPAPACRAAWREAFLTNAARGVQPLARLSCGAGNAWGLPAWEARFPDAPGPWTRALAAALAARGATDVRGLGAAAAG